MISQIISFLPHIILFILSMVASYGYIKDLKQKGKVQLSENGIKTTSLGFAALVTAFFFVSKIIINSFQQPTIIRSRLTIQNGYLLGRVVNQDRQPLSGAYVYIKYERYKSNIYTTNHDGDFMIPIEYDSTLDIEVVAGRKNYDENFKDILIKGRIPTERQLLILYESAKKIQRITKSEISIISNLEDSINRKLATQLMRLSKGKKIVLHLNFSYTPDQFQDFGDGTAEYHTGGHVLISIKGTLPDIYGPQLTRIQQKGVSTVIKQLKKQIPQLVNDSISKVCKTIYAHI